MTTKIQSLLKFGCDWFDFYFNSPMFVIFYLVYIVLSQLSHHTHTHMHKQIQANYLIYHYDQHFFWGEFSPLGQKQKVMWTHAKDFCEKNAPKALDFEETILGIAIFRQSRFQHDANFFFKTLNLNFHYPLWHVANLDYIKRLK